MTFLLLGIPIGVLCLYLSWLTCARNRRICLVLLGIGSSTLLVSLLAATFFWLLWPEMTAAAP